MGRGISRAKNLDEGRRGLKGVLVAKATRSRCLCEACEAKCLAVGRLRPLHPFFLSRTSASVAAAQPLSVAVLPGRQGSESRVRCAACSCPPGTLAPRAGPVCRKHRTDPGYPWPTPHM